MTRTKGLILLMVFVLIGAAFADVRVFELSFGDQKLSTRILNDEEATKKSAQASCKIESVGLTAQAHLTEILSNIHTLLTLPQTPSERQQQNQIPLPQRAYLLSTLTSLDNNLTAYINLENKQPKSRSC